MAKKTAKKTDKKAKAPAKPAAKAAKKVAKPVKKAAPAPKAAKKSAKPVAKKAAAPAKKPAKVDLKKAAKKTAEPLKKEALKKSAKDVAKDSAIPKDKKLKVEAKAPVAEPKGKKGKKVAAEVVEEEAPVEMKAPVKDIVLTDAEGRELCRVKDCDQPWVVEGYCRYHYLLFWKKIQNRKKILSEGKLEQYIEELTSRYPLKFLELIRKDLSTEADFFSAIQELDIDENNNIDEFEDENFMEEVRGIGSSETERVDDEY